jgi:hypothetical protein
MCPFTGIAPPIGRSSFLAGQMISAASEIALTDVCLTFSSQVKPSQSDIPSLLALRHPVQNLCDKPPRQCDTIYTKQYILSNLALKEVET